MLYSILNISKILIIFSLIISVYSTNYIVCPDLISACPHNSICCERSDLYFCCVNTTYCCDNGRKCCPSDNIKLNFLGNNIINHTEKSLMDSKKSKNIFQKDFLFEKFLKIFENFIVKYSNNKYKFDNNGNFLNEIVEKVKKIA
jgi:hypothetical protein